MDILKLRGFLLFLCTFLNLFLALSLWYKGRKNKVSFWMGFCALFSALYAFCCGGTYFFWRANSIASVYWYRSTWLGVLMLPPFVILIYYFAQKTKGLKLKAIFLYLGAVIISCLAFTTDLFVKSVQLKYPHISSKAGILDSVGRIFIFICIVIVLFNLLKEFFKSKGFRKLQLKYFILGMVIYAGGGIITTAIIPLIIGESPYYDITAYLSFVWLAFTSYAILRYRLMDIRVVMGKGAIYLFSFLSAIGVSFLLLSLNNKLTPPVSFNVFLPLTIVISVLLFQVFFRFFEKLASKYFYYTFYSYQKVLIDLGEKLTQILDLKKLSELIVNTLVLTMKLDRTVILLREENGNYVILKNIGFKEENGISLVKDNFLTRYLEKTRKILVLEELFLAQRDIKEIEVKEKEKLQKLQEDMKRIEANLCLPLFREQNIIGIIVLGRKVSGDPYSKEDLDLLATLASQSSIALQNARLYDQVQDFSRNLQKKVDEQTRELRRAYEELKRVDKAKSEFLSMASHQLRTPLTAIKGYLSVILEGDYGKPPEKMEKALENVFQASERLVRIVNDLLNVSRIELGKMETKKEKAQVEELIESCYQEMQLAAKKKDLDLVFQKPKTLLPKINIDKLKIRQVILNLIDNAIRYTKEGTITLNVQRKPSSILISVRDTGEGLTKEERESLFEEFIRGSAGRNLFIEGAGLGLFVAKKYLELHQGKIWAESPGKGKGSTFYIELPAK